MSSSEKTIKLLKIMAAPPFEYRVSDLAEALGCAKGGIHKLLTVLVAEGLAEQAANKKYRLGVGAFLVGKSYEENISAWRPFVPYLERLRDLTGENVSYGTWLNDEPTILYRLESPGSVRVMVPPGPRPLNTSAVSMALAAHADPEKIWKKITAEPLTPFTANSIVDPNELVREYARVRERGYSLSDRGYTEDAVGVGVPVWNKSGRVWAAISISAPKFRVSDEKLQEFIRLLKATAM